MTDKKVILLRGISGSGKSTYIDRYLPNAYVCSADHFFRREDGSYRFNATQLHMAHRICQEKFTKALEVTEPLVVVDNTNTRYKEYRYYLQEARKFGYRVEFVRLEIPVEVAAARNVHRVPREAVLRMARRMDEVPEGYLETVISGIE
jgi:predicted kinase